MRTDRQTQFNERASTLTGFQEGNLSLHTALVNIIFYRCPKFDKDFSEYRRSKSDFRIAQTPGETAHVTRTEVLGLRYEAVRIRNMLYHSVTVFAEIR
jgi:hypothetical protein